CWACHPNRATNEITETLIDSEFPWHMGVPPFSATAQSMKMKGDLKSHF
ncbi:MAG: hypothetical protein ACI822_001558, partial [Gammaproteobacteria bacterium]